MKPTLIIGAGITGVTAAVELAEAGKEVILVEQESFLGGNVIRFHNYFPKLCPPACGMELNFRRIKNSSRIRVLTHTRVKKITGYEGDYTVTLSTAPRMVTDLCTACGECVVTCPALRPHAFNENNGLTKAIYLPHPLAFPLLYEIDPQTCLGTSCGKCVEACQYDAINLNASETTEEADVQAIIMATGWKPYDAGNLEGLNYHGSPDIVTNMEFERLLSTTGPGKGRLLRPATMKPPVSVAFVQCAGSRDENHLPYCSAVCCSASLKHALNVAELLPETRVTIFYIDLRVTGRNEDFLRKVEQTKNIELVKGKVAKIIIEEATGNLTVEAEHMAAGVKMKQTFEMVVLATGIVPAGGVPGRPVNDDGFLTEGASGGIFAAGCAKRPMDVSTSVKDATAAAGKVLRILSNED